MYDSPERKRFLPGSCVCVCCVYVYACELDGHLLDDRVCIYICTYIYTQARRDARKELGVPLSLSLS